MTVQPGVHLPPPPPLPSPARKRDSMSFADEAVNIDEHRGKRRVMGADGYSIYFQPVMGDEETEARLQSLVGELTNFIQTSCAIASACRQD